MRKVRFTVLLGVLSALGAAASNVEAGVVPGSTIGEVALNAGPGVDPFGGNGDCYLPNLTMGRGELLSTGGISGRRISAYLFNSGGAGALHKSVKVVGLTPQGVVLSGCTALDNTKNATWVHRFYDTPDLSCTNALTASVTCYTTTNGT